MAVRSDGTGTTCNFADFLAKVSPAQTQQTVRFFVCGVTRGDAQIQQNNFVPLPARMQASIFKIFATIKDKAGNSIGLAQ